MGAINVSNTKVLKDPQKCPEKCLKTHKISQSEKSFNNCAGVREGERESVREGVSKGGTSGLIGLRPGSEPKSV